MAKNVYEAHYSRNANYDIELFHTIETSNQSSYFPVLL